MDPWMWAMLLKPLGATIIFACVLIPIRRAVQRFTPEGRLKRVLLSRFNES